MSNGLLTASSIRKSFGGVRALKGVSLDLASGEVHALVGENGAGKSTLIRILTGAERADAGSLVVDGAPVDLAQLTPARARDLGIAAVYQQPALFPDLTLAENIAWTLDAGSLWRRIDWQRSRRKAAELLARVGASIDPDRSAGSLSMPEQQLVEIARAVGANARVILMDEPTASLSDREVRRLFDAVARLREAGACIVYISHRLDEVFAMADRLTVLRDGESVTTARHEEITRAEVVRWMAGREVSVDVTVRDRAPSPVALEVRGLSSRAAGVHDISLSVRRGEILGIAGLVGAGRTELAETLFGLRPMDGGEILIDGAPVVIREPEAAIASGLAYVPEDRRRHGAVLPMTVAANTTLASLRSVSRHGIVSGAVERDLAERYVAQLRVRTPDVDTPLERLSGGNQQKVVLARWLATSPSVLMLDEPTQGVDVGAKAEIHALMRELAGRGLAILMISSEMPEVLAVSDRIAVMREGTIVATLDRAGASAERILALALAGPATVRGS
jgi:rhamnose transport system ATP-binding protein